MLGMEPMLGKHFTKLHPSLEAEFLMTRGMKGSQSFRSKWVISVLCKKKKKKIFKITSETLMCPSV